ncbi:succinate dehydrogenase assembly factor 2 [Pasteurellaceae bacterium 20609_3]|uniref:FAD assembly factor SdhE n=1 Tax=Spirabiliibacterium mucosae TaxID=28156 RepID=UPI001AAD2067|nr:succinate dehydrogenase assembly factor 2 [Spirabiliibacterium mucosae]MBE2897321.1 succinate dehydrogenase assembly factor 2 [Spirabiliibacterium mucosae]
MAQYNKLKLAWECRRGMLELDYMIMPFYQERFDSLSEAQQANFVAFLGYTDPQLFRWLMNQEAAPTEALREIVQLIQQHLASK